MVSFFILALQGILVSVLSYFAGVSFFLCFYWLVFVTR